MKMFTSHIIQKFKSDIIEIEYDKRKSIENQNRSIFFSVLNVIIAAILFPIRAADYYKDDRDRAMNGFIINYTILIIFCLTILILLIILIKRPFSFLINRILIGVNCIGLRFIFTNLYYAIRQVYDEDISVISALTIIEFIFHMIFISFKMMKFIEVFIIQVILSLLEVYDFVRSKSDENAEKYQENALFFFILYIISAVMITTFSYNYLKEDRMRFYLEYKTKKNYDWVLTLMDESNTGVVRVFNGEVRYINKKMLEFAKEICKHQGGNNEILERINNIDANVIIGEIAKFLFNNNGQPGEIEIEHENLLKRNEFFYKLKQYYNKEKWKKRKKFSLFTNNNSTYESLNNMNYNFKSTFVNLGQKSIFTGNEELTLEVLYRFTCDENNTCFEFIFNDFTYAKRQTEFKYKSLFFSKLAHEFKNPLITLTELTDEIIIDNKNIETNLNLIKVLSEYMLVLSKDLEAFSQMEMKINNQIVLTKVDLYSTINFVRNITNGLLTRYNKGKDIKIVTIINEGVPNFIYTDETKLKQILINLISNSVKFTNQGTISLELSKIPNKKDILIKVSDTGRGMSDKIKLRLFQPFQTLGESNPLGTGLGLLIVKEMTSKLGSEIEYSSEENKGSSFWFTIPLNDLSQEVSAIETRTDLYIDEEENSFLNKTITVPDLKLSLELNENNEENRKMNIKDKDKENKRMFNIIIADDEPLVQQSTRRVIEKYARDKGYKLDIFLVSDGYEVINKVIHKNKKNDQIHLILCDENMAYCNGNQCEKLIEKLVNENKISKIPFFVLSANKAIENKGSNYFTKPLSHGDAEIIFNCLNRRNT